MIDTTNYVTVDGIFIKQDFDHLILDEAEVDKYTTLTRSTLKQTMFIPFKYDVEVLSFYLNSYFAEVQTFLGQDSMNESMNGHQEKPKYDLKFVVDDIVVFYFERAQVLKMEWVTSPKNDLVADSLSLLILQINENPTPQLCNLMSAIKDGRDY